MAAENKDKASKFSAFLDKKYIPLDNKIKILIFIGLMVLPIVLFYFLSYTKNIQKIETQNLQKATLKSDIAKAKKAASELDEIKATIQDTEAKFKQTATVLPKDKEIPGLLTSISDLGKRAALDFNQFKPGAETPMDFYAEIPVDIQIQGPYHNLGYFLDRISKLERIVTVNNIKMAGPVQQGNEMILNSTLKLITYRFTGIQTEKDPKDKKKKDKK